MDGEGRAPTAEHLRRIADRSGVEQTEARAVLDEVYQATARWPELAEAAGVSRALRQAIARKLPDR